MRLAARPRRKLIIMLLLLAFACTGLVGHVEASEGMRGDKCLIAEDEVIVEDFYFLCRILDVKGTVEGDLIGAAMQITIHDTGVVTGDLWVGGGKLSIAGTVGDDIHFGGLTLTVENKAQFTNSRTDVFSVALNTEINRDAALPGDLLVYGYQARVDGSVGGDIDFGGEALIIEGTVEGKVDAEVGDPRRSTDVPGLPIYDISFSNPGLRIGQRAHIGGDLAYRSVRLNEIPPGVVQGRIRFEQVGGQPDITKVERTDDAAKILRGYAVASVRDMLTLVILGAVGLRAVPNVIRQPAQNVRRRTVPTIGWGLITFMLSIPLVIVVVVIGLILLTILYLVKLNELTIMVGVGLLVVGSGLVGGLGFLLFFLGRVVISYMLGQLVYRFVLRTPEPGTLRRWLAALVLGTAIYALVTNVPVPALGLIIELISVLAGVGAVVMYLRELANASNLFTRSETPETFPMTTVTPPSLVESAPAPGMANLPEGFKGFDDDW